MHQVRKETLSKVEPLTDIFNLPLYGFQFFFRHIDHFRRSFWILTSIRILSSVLKFYSTFIISQILSSITDLSVAELFQVYLPLFVGAVVLSEFLDYFTRRFAEELPYLYLDYASVKFIVTWLSLRSTRLLTVSKERLQQLTLKYLEGVQSFLTDWVWRIPSEMTTFIIVCALLAYQSPIILIINILVMTIYFSLAFWNSRRFSVYWEQYLKTSVSSRSYFQSIMTHLTSVQRLGALPTLESIGADHAVSTGVAMQEVKKFHGYRWLLQLNFFNLVYATTFFFGVYQVINGTLPLGFLILIKWAYDSLWNVMQYSIEAYVQLIGQRENALLVRKEFQALNGYFPASTTTIPTDWTKLELSNAHAEYEVEDGSRVNVVVPQLLLSRGTHISLSGPSGCGKTTVLHMLMNLVQFKGSYELNGASVKDTQISPTSIALVTTTDGFFPISIRDNLTLGSKVEETEFARILQGLQIDFISDLEEKFGAGVGFSAGQLQRLRLARGLMSQAQVLLLDEPFTGIDENTKDRITRFMNSELNGKTALFVTHDSRELRAFQIDKQYAFDNHTVVELLSDDTRT
jgi:ABC-type bacteriocin/lantibiotic exporter with double-glycine peptidase domain